MSARWMAAEFVLLLVCTGLTNACSVVLPIIQVKPSFSVLVRHGAVQKAGIPVEVYDYTDLEKRHGEGEWAPVRKLISGNDGRIVINDLGPGRYLVETRGPGGGSAVDVEVSPNSKKAISSISLEWPRSRNGKILKTRALKGELTSNPPFESVEIELWTAGAQSPLEQKKTGADGSFNFSELKPGLYVLRVHGHQKDVPKYWQVEGDIPIELVANESGLPESLSLQLGMTSCGIDYDT